MGNERLVVLLGQYKSNFRPKSRPNFIPRLPVPVMQNEIQSSVPYGRGILYIMNNKHAHNNEKSFLVK